MTYEVHPAARLFPRLEGKQFEELFFDIAMNGLREPVVVRGLEIVDGRNRLRAALRAGGTVRFEELGDDVDVYAFVSSANLYRRHLTTSQRVMLLVSRRPSSVQIAPGELHCAVARSVIVSESVPAGRTLTFQARSLPEGTVQFFPHHFDHGSVVSCGPHLLRILRGRVPQPCQCGPCVAQPAAAEQVEQGSVLFLVGDIGPVRGLARLSEPPVRATAQQQQNLRLQGRSSARSAVMCIRGLVGPTSMGIVGL